MKWFRKLTFTIWYFRDPPWDTNISPPELIEFLQLHSPGRALDMGCGTGTNVITLAKQNWQVIGIDYVRKAIRAAKRKARRAHVQAEFRVGDVTDLGWIHQPFDLVLDIGCLHSLDARGRKAYIQNLAKILAPEGIFLLYTFINNSASDSAGLTAADLDMISTHLDLVSRQDGKDGDWNSSWFTYRRSSPHQKGS